MYLATIVLLIVLGTVAQASIYDDIRKVLDTISPHFYNHLPTADFVDLNRYQGAWYEIVRLP